MIRTFLGLSAFAIFQLSLLVCGFVAFLNILGPYVHFSILLMLLPILGVCLSVGCERAFGFIGIAASSQEIGDDPSFFLTLNMSDVAQITEEQEVTRALEDAPDLIVPAVQIR